MIDALPPVTPLQATGGHDAALSGRLGDLFHPLFRDLAVALNLAQASLHNPAPASLPAIDRAQGSLFSSVSSGYASQPQLISAHYPDVLQHAVAFFATDIATTARYGREPQNGQRNTDDHAGAGEDDAIPFDALDIALFEVIDRHLPGWQRLGYCEGLLLARFLAGDLPWLPWRCERLLVLLPVGGQLGAAGAALAVHHDPYRPHALLCHALAQTASTSAGQTSDCDAVLLQIAPAEGDAACVGVTSLQCGPVCVTGPLLAFDVSLPESGYRYRLLHDATAGPLT